MYVGTVISAGWLMKIVNRVRENTTFFSGRQATLNEMPLHPVLWQCEVVFARYPALWQRHGTGKQKGLSEPLLDHQKGT